MEYKPAMEATVRFAIYTSLKSPVLTEAERSDFANGHGAKIYIPLEIIQNMKFHNNITIDEITDQLLDVYDVNKDFCFPCRTKVVDESHLTSPLHAARVAAQPFRLNACVGNLGAYQGWLSDHALGRQYTAAKGVKVKMEFLKTSNDIRYWYSKLVGKGHEIPRIDGKSELGAIHLNFKVQYWADYHAEVKKVRLIPTAINDDGYQVYDGPDITEMYTGNYGFRFQCNTPGFKYYSIQMWVEIERYNDAPCYYPLCCEVRINWQDSAFESNVQATLNKVPQKHRTMDGEEQLSRVPDSDHNPPRDTVPRFQPVRRVNTAVPLDHPALQPIFEYWMRQEEPDRLEAGEVRKRKLGFGDKPETSIEALGLDKCMDMETPVTKNNAPIKCVTEQVGEAQYKEDNLERAPCITVCRATNDNIPTDLDIDTTSTDAVYLRVSVPIVAYNGVKGGGAATYLRVTNRQWPEKFLAKVLDERRICYDINPTSQLRS